jgi:hypothetical protein
MLCRLMPWRPLKGTSALEGARASAAREELIDIDALEASDPPIAFLRPDFRVLSDVSISLSNMCGTSCVHTHTHTHMPRSSKKRD